jgi:signal transduction histidine kinase
MRLMDRLSTLISLCLIAAAVGMAWRERVLRQRLVRGTRGDREGRAAATRMLRLVAGDMRGAALSLLGHAGAPGADDTAISGTARRLLNLSEDVLNQTDTPDAPRRLEEVQFPLKPAVEFAVAQVAAQLGTAGRAWRIGPELAEVALFADQRALNQVLVLVLSSAAASTRGDDWIEISGAASGSEWVLMVQDEGIGLPMLSGDSDAHEGRGMGLGLALAKSLMAAHGGTLRIETAARVGTRVRLGFPAARRRGGPVAQSI